jgi:hypothetical protein
MSFSKLVQPLSAEMLAAIGDIYADSEKSSVLLLQVYPVITPLMLLLLLLLLKLTIDQQQAASQYYRHHQQDHQLT